MLNVVSNASIVCTISGYTLTVSVVGTPYDINVLIEYWSIFYIKKY